MELEPQPSTVGRIGPHKSGYVVVMFPVVAVVLSLLFEGLRLNSAIVTGVVLVIMGNVVILGTGKSRRELRRWLGELKRYWFDRKKLASEGCGLAPRVSGAP